MFTHLRKRCLSAAAVSRLGVVAMVLAVSFIPLSAASKSYKVTSPDGRVSVNIVPSDSLRFTVVTPSGQTVNAAVAMRLENNDFGVNPKIKKMKTASVDRVIEPAVPVKYSSIRDRYTDAKLNLGKYDVEFRVYDNAVAYRFVTHLPDSVNVMDEDFRVALPEGTVAHLEQPRGWKTSQEEPYTHKALKDWNEADRMSLMPALFELPGGEWVLVSESNLRDYSGMYLKGNGTGFNSVFPRTPLRFTDAGDRSVKI